MLYKSLVTIATAMLMLFGSSAAIGGQVCPEKSLLVNISAERVRGVQVGLLVAMANAGGEELAPLGGPGQEADVQLFFADAAAPYVLDLDALTDEQKDTLDLYLTAEFGYGVADVARLQTQNPVDDGLPGIFFLQDEPPLGYDVEVYACMLCVMETLGAIGIIDPPDVSMYLIAGAEPMTPDKFSVIYDRKGSKGCRPATASVISY
jgi:hypothetical protein